MSYKTNDSVVEDEIDLIELLKKLYLKKKFILKTSILALLFGIVYALFQPNGFTSTTTFIPQLSSDVKTTGSSLSGLASLAGISLGGMEGPSEFPPTLYPQVVESIGFRLDLLASIIKVNNENISLREYFISNKSFSLLGILKKYTIGLPSLIQSSFENEEIISQNSLIYKINEEDHELFEKLSEVFFLSVNNKEGFITLSFNDHDKNIAAQVAQTAETLLQDKIIEFKVQSSRELLEFTLTQYNEKKKAFEKLQDDRAIFVDKNINISSSLFQNKLNRIESELSIAQTVVQQLASQVEQAKLQVNKNTPVFTTIKPVTIPFQKSAPRRSLIVITFLFLGLVFSCVFVLVKDPVMEIIKSIKS